MLVSFIFASLVTIAHSTSEKSIISNHDSNVANLIKSGVFVDKSHIVKTFFESSRLIMLTVPRKFGKSTNLEIIRRFFELTVDKEGNVEQRNSTDNYKLFTQHNLNAYKLDKEFFFSHFGKYPVIYFDFQHLNTSNYETYLRSFGEIVSKEYHRHKYLLDLNSLNLVKMRDFYKIYNGTDKEVDLKHSINSLVNFLLDRFKVKPIILIDNYDGFVQNLIFTSSSNLKEIVDFMQAFTVNLKSNKDVSKGLLTCSLRLAPLRHTGENRIYHIPFLSHRQFYKLYGFTKEEVKLLLAKQNKPDMFDSITKWYGGYYSPDFNITLYNPSSIVQYLKVEKLDNYFINNQDITILRQILKHINYKIVFKLILNKPRVIREKNKIFDEDIILLKETIENPQKEDKVKNINVLLWMMTELGYFTGLTERRIGYEELFDIAIPNQEIKNILNSTLNCV